MGAGAATHRLGLQKEREQEIERLTPGAAHFIRMTERTHSATSAKDVPLGLRSSASGFSHIPNGVVDEYSGETDHDDGGGPGNPVLPGLVFEVSH